MQILHKVDNFLFTIFPEVTKKDKESLLKVVQAYYTFGPFKPKVKIKGEWLIIEIDTKTILSQEEDFKNALSFAEKGNYTKSKEILTKLIKVNPTVSEYHRV